MRRFATVLALCVATWAPSAFAADGPSPEQIQFAAHEHDLGYRAYVAKQYEEAGIHFENAFFAAPNPAELRSAMRARREAGQLARAATLAAIAQRKYADDAALGKSAEETLGVARPKVFEVHVKSTEDCNVTVDSKVVTAEKVRDFRFYVDPGKHDLVVGWSDDRSQPVSVDATAGGSKTLSLDAPPIPPKPVATEAGGGARPIGPPPPPPSTKPLPPVVFYVGAGLTAAGLGVTLWSGVDTLNNPGRDAVKAACVGQGTSCPQYQQGLSSQLRTNVLIGATAGVGAITAVIGLFFTQWSHPDAPADTTAPAAAVRVTPLIGPDGAALVGTF